jgi:hypothetical protein
MQQDKTYGLVLIASSAVLLAMGVTHPGRLPAEREALEHVGLIAAIAHSLATVGVWLALWGLAGLSRFLGLERPMVVGALLAFVLPASGVTVAAALDGFAVPALALRALDADEVSRGTLHSLIGYCVLVASSLTRIYLLLGAVAIAMWSCVILEQKLSRGLPALGLLVALVAIGTTFGGPAYISAHMVLLLALVQSAWMVWAGGLMLRLPRRDIGSGAGR